VALSRGKRKTAEYQEEAVDAGAKEKRSFIVEPEFARVLNAMKREGNTISSVIRQAWDSDRLQVLTRNPLRATETHISIIGHITRDELVRNLDRTETANGFANRFLWVFTRRSKYLPEGGNLSEKDVMEISRRVSVAVEHARSIGEVSLDGEAREKWIRIYPELSEGSTGLLGSVTSRAEAQVRRLACIYSLLEGSAVTTIDHLDAALAVWQYCEDSAAYIFGGNTGDRLTDKLYSAIKEKPEGLTRTEIRDLLQRNESKARIDDALKGLADA
jgi:hypothetical protein